MLENTDASPPDPLGEAERGKRGSKMGLHRKSSTSDTEIGQSEPDSMADLKVADSRVLFIDQTGQLGGAELSMLQIVCRRRCGDAVALLADGPLVQRLAAEHISVNVVPLVADVDKRAGWMSLLGTGPAVLRTVRTLRRRATKFDAVLVNTQKAAVVGTLAGFLARRPVIWHLRDMLDAAHFSAANRRLVVGLTNRLAHHVIANSNATAAAYQSAGGKLPVTVVHNGIDADDFDSVDREQVDQLRHDMGVQSDQVLIGVFGRLTPWKGQRVLLEAFEKLETRNLETSGLETSGLGEVHAIVVGEALFTDEDRRYADRLRREADCEPLRRRVHFLGHRDDVPLLMRACDIVVHTSTQPEPFGRVIVEGMLAGKPVIATAAGGVPEIIDDGINGLLVPPGDVAELAEALQRLISDPALRQRLATAGRETALQRFSVEQMVRGVGEVVDQVTRRPTNR